jgi:hypothetical protein
LKEKKTNKENDKKNNNQNNEYHILYKNKTKQNQIK